MIRKTKSPLARIESNALMGAADYAVEESGHLLPTPELLLTTAVPVGYLRRVPQTIEPILKDSWPWSTVRWTTYIERGRPLRRQPVLNLHVVYPTDLLKPFLAFLNPAGKLHLATLDVAIVLDKERIHDLSTITKPQTDHDNQRIVSRHYERSGGEMATVTVSLLQHWVKVHHSGEPGRIESEASRLAYQSLDEAITGFEGMHLQLLGAGWTDRSQVEWGLHDGEAQSE